MKIQIIAVNDDNLHFLTVITWSISDKYGLLCNKYVERRTTYLFTQRMVGKGRQQSPFWFLLPRAIQKLQTKAEILIIGKFRYVIKNDI
jgi:hypothetical protein